MNDPAAKYPLFAIVTPVYNGAAYLAETMDSVQAQTYPNIIHFVLDNASTDATPEILERYANARIPVVVKRNPATVSMGVNWNLALELVPPEAPYFRVLCADDLMAPEFSAQMVGLAMRHPGVVAVGCELDHRGGELSGGWEPDREVFDGREAVGRFLKGDGTIVAHQTIFRRDVLDMRKPFFEVNMTTNDTDACLDILRHGDWGFVHEKLAVTRDHGGTDTNTLVKPLQLDLGEHLVLMKRYAEFGLGSKEGRRFFACFRRYYLRRLLKWRAAGQTERVARHLAMLNELGAAPSVLQFLDAVADWPWTKLALRPAWSGYPA
ncbi:MAG: glycosyltransferase [Alphaproteobacteria bacterium]|nr:glycosyltransferase [Alphaproteobacteria bacterium]